MGKRINKRSLVLLFLIALGSCMDRIDSREILIVNNSKDTIYNVLLDADNMSEFADHYEWSLKADAAFRFVFIPIAPKQKETTNDRPRSWDSYFEEAEDKKVRLFIIAKDSVNKYGWTYVLNKEVYNKKYSFSKQEIDNLKWTIIYK